MNMSIYHEIFKYFLDELASGRQLDPALMNRISHFKYLLVHLEQKVPVKLCWHIQNGINDFSASFASNFTATFSSYGTQRYADFLKAMLFEYNQADKDLHNSPQAYAKIHAAQLSEARFLLENSKKNINENPPKGATKFDMHTSWHYLNMALKEAYYKDRADISTFKELLHSFLQVIKEFQSNPRSIRQLSLFVDKTPKKSKE